MEMLLAVICPPAAICLCRETLGRNYPRTVCLSLLLWVLGVIPGVLHALWIVARYSPARHAHRQPQLGRPNPFGTQ